MTLEEHSREGDWEDFEAVFVIGEGDIECLIMIVEIEKVVIDNCHLGVTNVILDARNKNLTNLDL